ncbi:MAG: exodeoxyribonuclease VII large subunit, partial [Acidimicrobiia bacterium]
HPASLHSCADDVLQRHGQVVGDFLHELGASGLAWKVLQVDTRVQGSDAAVAIGRSVEHLGSRVDVIAVVRGGGAATDLAVFDDERVARAIAGAPVQIFTGIGHEIDTTVADAVAARSLKTPTACGAALVSRVTDAVAALDRRGTAIGTAARSRVGLDRVRIAGHSRRLAALSTGVLRARIAKLDRAMSDTRVLGMRALRSAAAALATREARVTAHDPAFLFARGWSVTTTKTGEPLKSVTSVETGSDIVTRLADGFVDSSVDKVRSDREGGAQ